MFPNAIFCKYEHVHIATKPKRSQCEIGLNYLVIAEPHVVAQGHLMQV